MTQLPQQQPPGAQMKPKPNIYTLLLAVSVIILGVTVGVLIWNLTSVYALEFGDLFKPDLPVPIK